MKGAKIILERGEGGHKASFALPDITLMIHDKAHSRTPGSQRVRQDSALWSPILYIHHWARAMSDMSVNRSVAPDPAPTSGCCWRIENVSGSTVNQWNKQRCRGSFLAFPTLQSEAEQAQNGRWSEKISPHIKFATSCLPGCRCCDLSYLTLSSRLTLVD